MSWKMSIPSSGFHKIFSTAYESAWVDFYCLLWKADVQIISYLRVTFSYKRDLLRKNAKLVDNKFSLKTQILNIWLFLISLKDENDDTFSINELITMYYVIFEIDFTFNYFSLLRIYMYNVYQKVCYLCIWYLLNKIFLKTTVTFG